MHTARSRRWLAVGLLALASAASFFVVRARQAGDSDEPRLPAEADVPPPPEHVEVEADMFALLVGCTDYPVLKKLAADPAVYEAKQRLLGPGNDVDLMRDVLHRYLGVPDGNIRTLKDWPDDEAARPTRANILGQLDRLAREARPGSYVFFLYAGHGSRQWDDATGEESDGQDEILMPADSGDWDQAKKGVANVITDDEIRARLVAIRDAGAQVWAVFDCCHSGTMTRGVDDVRLREIDPAVLGVPSRPDAPVAKGPNEPSGGLLERGFESQKGIAAFCAVHPSEPAPEMVLPRGGRTAAAVPHGLLSYQVARALQRYGGNLALSELYDHVVQAYAAMSWSDSRPLFEGDVEHMGPIPGVHRGESVLYLSRDGGRSVVDAGSLRGLTVGSVLRAYAPGKAGQRSARLGRLTVTEVGPLRSICAPAAGESPESTIPDGAPCLVVDQAPAREPLRIAWIADEGDGRGVPPSVRSSAVGAPKGFRMTSPADADWLLRGLPTQPSGISRVLLSPAKADPGFEPIEVEAGELAAALGRIDRAARLRALASSLPLSGLPGNGVSVEARMRRAGSTQDLALDPGTSLAPGDSIFLRVANETGRDVGVAVAWLDAGQVESLVWPPAGEASRTKTWEEKQRFEVSLPDVYDDACGLESVLVVAATRAPGARALIVSPLTVVAEDDSGTSRNVDPSAAKPADDRLGVREIRWRTTWGSFDPAALRQDLVSVDPPAIAPPGSPADTRPPGRGTAWRRARLVPGDSDCADVLVLEGEGAAGADVFAVLVDEDHDAGLDAGTPSDAARRAAAGRLPVEVMVVIEPARVSASYPRARGDLALGHVRVALPGRDRADRRFDLDEKGWASRETAGPWLSSALVPTRTADPAGARLRIIRALRRFIDVR